MITREELRGAAALTALILGSWLIVLAAGGILYWMVWQVYAVVTGGAWW